MRPLLLRGRGPAPQRLLVLTGRRTGAPRSIPVALLEYEGQRYIVAGYATADWVLNARNDPRGELVRGSVREPVRLVQLPSGERPPILRAFLRSIPGGRRKAGAAMGHGWPGGIPVQVPRVSTRSSTLRPRLRPPARVTADA